MTLFLKIEIAFLLFTLVFIVLRAQIKTKTTSVKSFSAVCFVLIFLLVLRTCIVLIPYATYVNTHWVLHCINYIMTIIIIYCWLFAALERLEVFSLTESSTARIVLGLPIVPVIVMSAMSPFNNYLFKLNLFGAPVQGQFWFYLYAVVALYMITLLVPTTYRFIKNANPDDQKTALYSYTLTTLICCSLLYTCYRQNNIFVIINTIAVVILYTNFNEAKISTDALTGLNNRNRFRKYLSSVMGSSATVKSNIYLTYIDVDDFKAINDQHGHLMGDVALRTVAESMRDVGKEHHCFLARIGGDEFVIISHHQREEDHLKMLHLLEDYLGEKAAIAFENFSISFSVGSTNLNVPNASANELLKIADKNMYRNKILKKARREKEELKNAKMNDENKQKRNDKEAQ